MSDTRILNRNATAGYRVMMGAIRLDDIRYDPWGTSMSWMFALAEVTFVESGEILPEFRPSPALRTRDDLEPESTATDVLAFIDSGAITLSDVRAVFDVLSRFDLWCRQAGRNY